MIKRAIIIICVLTFVIHAQANSNDGNEWRKMDRFEKLGYIKGFLDGHNYIVWKTVKLFLDSNITVSKPFLPHILENSINIFYNITYGQMIEGLDSLYVDYRNRLIQISDGLEIVVTEIRGKSKSEILMMIEEKRKLAGRMK